MNSKKILLDIILFIVLFFVSILFSYNAAKINKPIEIAPATYYSSEYIFKYSSDDLICLARNIYFEAATESDLGKYAVAHITINRYMHSNWPRSICNVIYQPYQFSWTLNKKLRNFIPKKENAAWQRSLMVAHNALYKGARVVALENSYFYHADYVNPRWAAKKQVVTTIDRHIFYTFAGF